ncbi:MAG: glycoside hydrolase family 2 [Ferruginibacter sp.]|nr:glycoside hydrolase family 2 [Ferruginibacter sp.]
MYKFNKQGFFFFIILIFNFINLQAQQTIIQYLSGRDKDHTVKWDFMVNKGRNSGKWSTIPVPSCWETQGFGTYNYNADRNNPGEVGMYKHNFKVSSQYKGKKIFLVFDASMTDTEVKINGTSAGPTHQGSFYQFKYDITELVQYDKPNLLEATVSKMSANNSINRAERQSDFWLFGGIFRPVYLQIVPATFIERVAIDAKATGDFSMQVFNTANPKQTVEAQVYDLKGKVVEKAMTVIPGDTMFRHHFNNVKLWNAEEPNLYNVVISIKEGAKTIHTIKERFGFRTAELRMQDGFYVNGKKVVFKGVCRHSEWPESGRTLSREIHLMDIATMKGMNMNAVRMSHYPPDKEFLDLCDSLGLFVLDELAGWQKAYDTVSAKRLVKEMVIYDVNHPSIVIWDNGNEGGWNRSVDNDYALYDPQKRLVIHPWEKFNGTNTKHYPVFSYIQNEIANAKEVFMPTEFMHGLFDGGHGAALEDFWNEMMKHPYNAGGFLWALHDEGLVRNDWHDSIDVAGNNAPDGIVGPHREKEGSYYTIKELWSPVYIEANNLNKNFNGKIEVQNRYIYSSLDKIKFEWQLVTFPGATAVSASAKIIKKGTTTALGIAPGGKGILTIPLPLNSNAGAFYITAFGAKGDTICTWSWAMQAPLPVTKPITAAASSAVAVVKEDDQSLAVSCDGIQYHFDKATGYLQQVMKGSKKISFHGGPALAGSNQALAEFKNSKQGNAYLVEPLYKSDSLKVKWTFQSGRLPKLEYGYTTRDTADYFGITFNYPEEKMKGMKWLGRGPYRVWKNRLKGQQFGVWQKDYNNTITGESWDYPEFKGWHSQVNWVTVQNKESDFTVYTANENVFFQMLEQAKQAGIRNNNTLPPSPGNTIGFFNAIPAIGTKFNRPEVMGPQSQRTVRQGSIPLTGTLYFDFR